MRRQLVLLLVLAALAGSGATSSRRLSQQEPSDDPTTMPPPKNDAADPFPDVGAPDCAADASAVDLARSRALALERSGGGGSGFVVVTAAVVQVGAGARCSAGDGGGGGLELLGSPAAGAEKEEEEEIHLLLYAQCVHSGVLSCRANEDGGGGGGGSQGGPVDLSSACVLVARVQSASAAADDSKDGEAFPTSSCTLAQGGKYTFLLQEEEEEEEAAAGGRRCQGRYRLAGSGVWDSVRPPSGLAACVPWPAWPEPPGVDEREAPGEIGALLTARDGRCPGGASPARVLAADDWRAACSLPADEPAGAAGTRGRRRGACPPSSGVACFPRAACRGRMLLGQVLLPGLGEGGDGERGPTIYVDRVTGAPLGGCGAGLERGRAQGRRVKRVAAAAAAGGEGRLEGQDGPLLPRRLGLAQLAAAGR